MPKSTYSRILLHTTDAEFRQWALDLSTALKACLTQTSDTGQVDWTLGTQVRPGAGLYTYYEVYRFSDALQATRPVFIKVEYGTSATLTNPAIRITIAAGTNGAGTLTAPTFLTATAGPNVAPPAGIATTTYVCAKDGYFGLAWQTQPTPSANNPHFTLVIDRSRDTTGAATGNALFMLYNAAASSVSAVATVYSYDMATSSGTAPRNYSLVPDLAGAYTSMSALTKIFPFRVFTPDEYAVTGAVNHLSTEVPPYTEFDVAPLPGMATVRYLVLGAGLWNSLNQASSTLYAPAIRYET